MKRLKERERPCVWSLFYISSPLHTEFSPLNASCTGSIWLTPLTELQSKRDPCTQYLPTMLSMQEHLMGRQAERNCRVKDKTTLGGPH